MEGITSSLVLAPWRVVVDAGQEMFKSVMCYFRFLPYLV